MDPKAFHHTITSWISALDNYPLTRLLAKPSPSSWSIGQVYMHLIENTNWFFEQIKICVSCNDHSTEEATAEGKRMLLNNEFPNSRLQGPPDNDFTPQPKSKEDVLQNLLRQKHEATILEEAIRTTSFNGKTRHPGLGYFNGAEWLQFAEMHLRHHIRQKQRIDAFLLKERI